jgi:hypothetical protein
VTTTTRRKIVTDVSEIARRYRTANVLGEVMAERAKQYEKWGDQVLPFHQPGDHNGVVIVGRSYTVMAEMMKTRCDIYRDHALAGHPDLRNNALVLLEEVFEALAETDPVKIRAELVQVAAVAVKAIETLDRREVS